MNYQICKRCIMDNSVDPQIYFNEEGICKHCLKFDEVVSQLPKTEKEKEHVFEKIIAEIKENGKGKEYDCVIGISGGVDSAYLAYVAKKAGLRILAVHVDAGWNTDIAVDNIKKLCSKLELQLHTIKVDWTTMKELQRAYMFSGLSNIDVPQDHVFLTATFKYAMKYGIKYMLTGSNFATEGIMPPNYGYAAIDARNIKDVYKKCGRKRVSLNKYPMMNLFTYSLMYIGKTKKVNLLNYVPYSQKLAIETLHREFGWNYYGGKHYESIFTKFLQAYYLPRKFGYDKKRAHLASLVVGGDITREEALVRMQDDSVYPLEEQLQDKDYILEKLEITNDEWEMIMSAPNKTEDDYKNNKKLLLLLQSIKKLIKK